jgi:hemoglobin-like flavoprotein
MTPKQIALVQDSWKRVVPMGDQAAGLLYARLFALDPSLEALFKGDMREQGRKVMSMISVAVNSLTRLESIVPAVQALGRRHARYGVEDRHYATVEDALVWTLRQGLGAGFTKEVEEAWRTAYGILATTMQQGSSQREGRYANQPATA